MAELQLEDAAFVLLSRLVNLFEDPDADFRWTDAIEVGLFGAAPVILSWQLSPLPFVMVVSRR